MDAEPDLLMEKGDIVTIRVVNDSHTFLKDFNNHSYEQHTESAVQCRIIRYKSDSRFVLWTVYKET